MRGVAHLAGAFSLGWFGSSLQCVGFRLAKHQGMGS